MFTVCFSVPVLQTCRKLNSLMWPWGIRVLFFFPLPFLAGVWGQVTLGQGTLRVLALFPSLFGSCLFLSFWFKTGYASKHLGDFGNLSLYPSLSVYHSLTLSLNISCSLFLSHPSRRTGLVLLCLPVWLAGMAGRRRSRRGRVLTRAEMQTWRRDLCAQHSHTCLRGRLRVAHLL